MKLGKLIGITIVIMLFFTGLSVTTLLNAETAGEILKPPQGRVWYVSISTGNNKNEGTKESPLKNIAKAIKKANDGDVIAVEGGHYAGVRKCGYIISDKAVKIYGSFSPGFSQRDIVTHPTVFQPDNKSAKSSRKAFLKFTRKVNNTTGIVVDGIVFDMGERNSYHDTKGKPAGCETGMLLLPPAKNTAKNDNATVTEQCIFFETNPKGGDITVKNCAFVNGAKFAIQGGHKKGTFKVLNNVFVVNRMAAIEIFGTGGKKGPRGPIAKGGHVEIAYNTILFSWSRTKNFNDMGYGCRVMTKLSYDIHHNLIGGNIMAGVDHSRFNRDEWLKLDHNIFFVNKGGDLEYSPESNTKELIYADD